MWYDARILHNTWNTPLTWKIIGCSLCLTLLHVCTLNVWQRCYISAQWRWKFAIRGNASPQNRVIVTHSTLLKIYNRKSGLRIWFHRNGIASRILPNLFNLEFWLCLRFGNDFLKTCNVLRLVSKSEQAKHEAQTEF